MLQLLSKLYKLEMSQFPSTININVLENNALVPSVLKIFSFDEEVETSKKMNVTNKSLI